MAEYEPDCPGCYSLSAVKIPRRLTYCTYIALHRRAETGVMTGHDNDLKHTAKMILEWTKSRLKPHETYEDVSSQTLPIQPELERI